DRLPSQPGDVQRTGGSIAAARSILGWEPVTPLPDGLAAEVAWVQDRSRRFDVGVDGQGAVGSPARRG
ncbi:MAG TPA: hypothetical protein VFZ17_02760, partial [Acidimicrobiia bacterium]|nr:hypothetical protein [Acidimicrobiia bacterium]